METKQEVKGTKAKKAIPHNQKAKMITDEFFSPNEVVTQDGDRVSASAEIFKEIMKQTYNKDDIALKTELNVKQVRAYTSAQLFSERYGLPLLGKLVTGLMEKNVSLNRKGRKEFVTIAEASFQGVQNAEIEGRQSIPDRLMGRSR